MMLGTAGLYILNDVLLPFKAREEILLGDKVNDVLVTGATGGCG